MKAVLVRSYKYRKVDSRAIDTANITATVETVETKLGKPSSSQPRTATHQVSELLLLL